MYKTTLFITGGTGSGKTVAACNVFHHMTDQGGVSAEVGNKKYSFSLVGTGYDADFFDTQYLNMLTGDPLPRGSTENTSYDLVFEDNGKSIASILYMDYRGGMTKDNTNIEMTPQQRAEQEEFDFMLGHAGLLIFIIPGNVLQDYLDLSSIDKGSREYQIQKMKINREMNLIRTIRLRAENLGNHAPILYYATKSDLVGDEKKIIPAMEGLIRDWKLQPEGTKVLGCHSTVGRHAVVSNETSSDGQSVSRIVSGFAPEGFEIPMLLTVGHRLSTEGNNWAIAQEKKFDDEIRNLKVDKQSATERYVKDKNSIKNKFLGFITRKDRAQDAWNAMNEKERELAEKEAEKQQIAAQNVDKQHSQNILEYLNAKYPNQVLYLDETGTRSSLENFFK